MAVLLLLIPPLIWALAKLATRYFNRRTADLQQKTEALKAASAARAQIDPTAFGLPSDGDLDPTRATAPGADAAQLAQAEEAATAGDWKPFAAYLAEAGTDWNERYRRLWKLAEHASKDDGWLSAWRAAEPGSADAAVVHATALIDLAWQVRSSKQAKHVTREQFDAFHRVLGEATEASRAAAELAPDDPSPFVSQLPIAMGLGWSHEQFDALWQQVIARAPYHYSAHQTALQYWCRKWSGSHEQMSAFAERAAAGAPPESLLSGLRLAALHELEFTEDDYRSWMTPQANQAIDKVIADLKTVPTDDPRLPGLHHLLAYGLTHNRRWAEAVEQFRLADRYIDHAPWTYTGRPKATYIEIRNRARTGWDKAGRPTPPTA
ncbi:DUF4034 domain-containing protein [Kitasatospora aureofaciens]|uniref:Uncharacterized protein n=1 Tax=Kitasatospora aureofaciens TaxID=1894 RepID=A0A1E7NBP1_KITAU|nr:DUF4034 domain-containing protein [Kitasatospora aureofaciens]ARF79682.1 hypothetical protein B6264_12900 [Kitasatospora aureofaciens]OEV38111.1 hypothetical protein HS99_0023205 [Kitasatospora aureofaciens]GGU87708.1 hypothetical protein GCM10010502_45340 [Kitasatospora aureofaciens]